MQVSEFPDFELWLTGYLRAALGARSEPYAQGVVVDTKVQNPRVARMVVVRRDGGPKTNLRQEVARVGINVWGSTEQEATDLARLTRALLAAGVGSGPVRKVVESSGPSPIADVQPRRFMVVEFTIAGSVLTV